MRATEQQLSTLAGNMIHLYEALLGESRLSTLCKSTNLLGNRLRALKAISTSPYRAKNLNPDTARMFLEALLDCASISAASGSRDSSLSAMALTSCRPLGRKRDLWGVLRGSDAGVEDWLFRTLVSSWCAVTGDAAIRDLDQDPSLKGQRKADFAIERNGYTELLECKRVHPHHSEGGAATAGLLPKLAEGVLINAADQLCQTEKALGSRGACKHCLVDFAAYSQLPWDLEMKAGDMRCVGFSEADARGFADEVVAQAIPKGIDVISLCWRILCFVEGLPIAVSHNTITRPLSWQGEYLRYKGWTVETYMDGRYISGSCRVSSTVRDNAWIWASHHGIMDNLLTWGKVETL